MHVVTAGVHDVHFFARIILCHYLARVGQPGFFLDRQRIHVGADEHDRSVAIFHQADDAITGESRLIVFADVIRDLATGGLQFLRDQLRSAFLLGR